MNSNNLSNIIGMNNLTTESKLELSCVIFMLFFLLSALEILFDHFDCEFDHFDCEFDHFVCEFDHFVCEFDHFDCEFDHFVCEYVNGVYLLTFVF